MKTLSRDKSQSKAQVEAKAHMEENSLNLLNLTW